MPIPVVAATTSGPLTAADITALNSLQAKFHSVTGITQVLDVGRSANGQAVQLLALADNNSGNQNYQQDLIDGMRAKIASAGLPAGLRVHLAGSIAVQVDEQTASGNTGNRVQPYSIIFIILLLVLIFRSLTLAITTLLPPFLRDHLRPAGGRGGPARPAGLAAGAVPDDRPGVRGGHDYGLFLVFRAREELRKSGHDVTAWRSRPLRTVAGRALGPDLGPAAGEEAIDHLGARSGIDHLLRRHGDRRGADSAPGDLPVLLRPGIPFAIAIGVTLMAGLTLLPALLSLRLSLLAISARTFLAVFGKPKLMPSSIQGSAGRAYGRIATRIVRRPAPTLLIGLVAFGGSPSGVFGYTAAGFGGNTTPPPGSDSAPGTAC